jgi:hypothetical protein
MYIPFIKTVYAQGFLPDRLVPCSGADCTLEDLYTLGYNVINTGLNLAAIIAVLVILWGGILIITAGGSQENLARGKSAIQSAIIGLIIVLGSWLIVNTIITVFTNCTGWHIFGSIRC